MSLTVDPPTGGSSVSYSDEMPFIKINFNYIADLDIVGDYNIIITFVSVETVTISHTISYSVKSPCE